MRTSKLRLSFGYRPQGLSQLESMIRLHTRNVPLRVSQPILTKQIDHQQPPPSTSPSRSSTWPKSLRYCHYPGTLEVLRKISPFDQESHLQILGDRLRHGNAHPRQSSKSRFLQSHLGESKRGKVCIALQSSHTCKRIFGRWTPQARKLFSSD